MTLDPDPLTVPEPPPQPRRRVGCSVFGWLVLAMAGSATVLVWGLVLVGPLL